MKPNNPFFLLSMLVFFCASHNVSAQTDISLDPKLQAKMSALLPSERNTIEIFQKASAKVVYVHRLATVKHKQHITQIPAGTGSGIIWDAQGHVVTNFHVIKGADHLSISLGGLTVPAKIIGSEPRKDLAVLAITSPKALTYLKDFKPFTLIHSHDLLVGQKAIAIGNPFGLDHSLTVGVISALGRKVPGIGGVSIHDMIQTDASVNPGNSGGPLLDSAGRLIGLNTMIYSRSGTSSGIGFVVPSDDIERTVNQIIKHGRVRLAGIGIHRVAPNIAERLGIKKGILIGEVIAHTPAAKAGIQGTYRNHGGEIILGDTIVALNGHPIPDYDDLYNLLNLTNIGEEVTLSVLRQGKKLNLKIKTIDIAGL
jgi:S1-C subfamily serine protease